MIRKILMASALVISGSVAQSAEFSFTGSFDQDDDVQFFNFTVGSGSIVTLRSYSYAGGTQADGNVVAAGGFDPILALFNATTGLFIDDQDDAGDDDNTVLADPITGARFDVLFEEMLAADDYIVAISQYANFRTGDLGDPFTEVGNPTFTSSYGCSNGVFCDVTSDNRTNDWAFDILNVASADVDPDPGVVPLPATGVLLLAGVCGLAALRRRR